VKKKESYLMGIPVCLIVLIAAGLLTSRHGPISEADRRKNYGDSFIYGGAPFCCIYVGLETNEIEKFQSVFWHFADQHQIHEPTKHYMAYSGPPRVTCKSDHVSVFVQAIPTADVVANHAQHARPGFEEDIQWTAGLWSHAYWPTNASQITKDGKEVLAPMTGSVRMAPNDINYPLMDFQRLSKTLTGAFQAAFPERAVRVFAYNGDTN
jgi:hypothetical protein